MTGAQKGLDAIERLHAPQMRFSVGRPRRRTVALGAALLVVGGSSWALFRPASLPPGVLHIVPVAGDAISVGIAVDPLTGRIVMQSGDITRSGTVSVLEAATGRLVRATAIGPYPAHQVLVDARASRAFVMTANTSGTAGTIVIVDTRSGKVIQSLATSAFLAVAVDPAIGHVFVAPPAPKGGVRMLDARSGKLLRVVAVTGDQIVIDGRTGHTFIVDNQANRVSMVDTRTGGVLRRVHVGGMANGTTVAMDERMNYLFIGESSHMVCSGSTSSSCRFVSLSHIIVLDTHTGRIVRTLTTGTAFPTAIAVDARTNRAFVFYTDAPLGGDETGLLRVLDARTARVLHTLKTAVRPYESGVAVDRRRGRIYAVDPNNGTQVFDAATGQLIRTIAAPGDAIALDERSGHAFVARRWSPQPTFIDLGNIWNNLQAHFTRHWNNTGLAPGQSPGSVAIIDASP